MSTDLETFNRDLYDLLKVRGYKPAPLDSKNQRVPASQSADVIQFNFVKDDVDYGKAWVTLDDTQNLTVYYDSEQQESPSSPTPGSEFDDSWTGFLKHLKKWAQRRQLGFVLRNKDRLDDDMTQREYYKMKEKLGESKKTDQFGYEIKGNKKPWGLYHIRPNKPEKLVSKHHNKNAADAAKWDQLGMGATVKGEKFTVKKIPEKDPVQESYHPMGKKASYNDAVPNVKIVLQHNRSLEEGEARFRNVAKIYLENAEGERFLAPTTKPGIARVYARHIAEGGLPNDERWNHIKTVCEDYNKMAGFVRATRTNQFNESVQELIQEGINHYNNLRETLHKLSTHRGYNTYFESYTPTLMEDDAEDISEMFMSSSLDPRIESAMPILSRLRKPVSEMAEVSALESWADEIINEKLEVEEAREMTPSLKAAQKNLVDLSTGEVAKREAAKKAAARRQREYERQAARDAKPKKPTTDQIWQKVEHAISNYFPDGDPIDYLGPYMERNNLTWDDITRACKKQGYKDLWDYWNTLAQDTENDAYGDWLATDGKNVRQRAPYMEDDEQLDELSPQTVNRYMSNADKQAMQLHYNLKNTDARSKKATDLKKKFKQRDKGLSMAGAKLAGLSKVPLSDVEAQHDVAETKDKQGDDYKKWRKNNFNDKKTTDEIIKGTDTRTKFDLDEDLGPEQKKVGQLGPTEKITKKNPTRGKLVGANESVEHDELLARIIEMTRFNK